MSAGLSHALDELRRTSREYMRRHERAVEWVAATRIDCKVVWLPKGWASNSGREIADCLVSRRALKRLRELENGKHMGLRLRALHIRDERAAMQVAVRDLLGDAYCFNSTDLFVRYTRLGQPMPGWKGGAASLARERNIRLRDMNISFSHDGAAVLAIASHAPGLRGAGIDVVHLDRLRGHGRDYLYRFARRFMSEYEFHEFESKAAGEEDEAVLKRAAAHFSLMESGSKALGTGLKIGGGMGKPESLPKQSINVRISVHPSETAGPERVEFDLEADARKRMMYLQATQLEGYVSADSEYLVSAAFLKG